MIIDIPSPRALGLSLPFPISCVGRKRSPCRLRAPRCCCFGGFKNQGHLIWAQNNRTLHIRTPKQDPSPPIQRNYPLPFRASGLGQIISTAAGCRCLHQPEHHTGLFDESQTSAQGCRTWTYTHDSSSCGWLRCISCEGP